MSCQQVSRFITNNNNNTSNNINKNNQINSICKNINNNQNHIIIKGNRPTIGVIQQEDPYVFTESVPTTPVLFNVQKTRTRLNELISSTNTDKFQQQKSSLTETNGKITPHLNELKTQESLLSLTTPANACTSATSKTNLVQSITVGSTIISNNNSKKLANVCVVRPQLQKQQAHYHHYQQAHQHQNYVNSLNDYEGDLKSISPPPLYTPPTPSLWQTPLLLESTMAASGKTSCKVINVVTQKAPIITSQGIPIMASAAATTVPTVGSATTTMTPPLTTTAMAKVAPIVVHSPLAPPPPPSPSQSPNQCLPPSKFHNHTLAQHLQKVECLKKSKALTEADKTLCNDNADSCASSLKSPTATLVKDNAVSPVKHSESENMSEIPVNVIFRMALQANEKSSNNVQYVKPQIGVDIQPQPQAQTTSSPQSLAIQTAPPSSLATTQRKTNMNKKFSTPASKKIVTKQLAKLQELNTSSIPQQQPNAIKTSAALNSQQQPAPNANDHKTPKKQINTETITQISTDDTNSAVKNPKKKNSAHISCKSRKLTSFPSASFDLPFNWQNGSHTPKGAVAIMKISQHDADMDTTHLATASGLPYCLQQYWLNSYDICKYSSHPSVKSKSFITRSLAREECIAVYKQELRRKAMQLFSTRSLQKLPLQLAKRRLLCVDRLLRKYNQNQENNTEIPANVKRCCIKGCDSYTLEMASHCQRHIVHNAAQHVFLPCTAKFADNTQCRVPVFDITDNSPLCREHAHIRAEEGRCEKGFPKVSTNPIAMNDSTITAKISAGITIGGIAKQTQNNQRHQNILQQLPANVNKRPALVNQPARKRKVAADLTVNPVGRPQKRVKKNVEKSMITPTQTTITKQQMPRLTSANLKRKGSTTSLESITSNSQHSTTSSTSQQPQQYQQHLQPQQHLYGVTPMTAGLAPLTIGSIGQGLPQHLFSFDRDNLNHQHPLNQIQRQQQHTINNTEKHSASTNASASACTPTELKDFISQFSFISQKHTNAETTTAEVNLLNTNSNSNFTSSGMGSTTSLPTADDFLTQDMLSICENSSASSADTGLGGLSDPELMLGGPEDDIPLGDTHLLEEHDLENVLNSLPEDAFKELFTTVHQDESDEIERAIELADKHLKTLQQTIGSELGDFLDFSDDMLMNNGDLCNGSSANHMLDTTSLFIGDGTVDSTSLTGTSANKKQGGGAIVGTDIRGLVQT